jgi:hypothetical protein
MKKTPVRPSDKIPPLWTAFAEKEDFHELAVTMGQ